MPKIILRLFLFWKNFITFIKSIDINYPIAYNEHMNNYSNENECTKLQINIIWKESKVSISACLK